MPSLPAQTQEMWSFLVPCAWLLLFATDEQLQRAKEPANGLLLAMFLIHYFNRCHACRSLLKPLAGYRSVPAAVLSTGRSPLTRPPSSPNHAGTSSTRCACAAASPPR